MFATLTLVAIIRVWFFFLHPRFLLANLYVEAQITELKKGAAQPLWGTWKNKRRQLLEGPLGWRPGLRYPT